ncbi:hypothetical protein [Streptomyces sp. cg35]|uniref:hypothetical protein n=1 Tax=Streptomyces sp. cg35 TaxID=3421650 RepID=UPI003D16F916
MPAKRPQQLLSPAEMDFSDIPMTDAMGALVTISSAVNDLKAVGDTLDVLVKDASEVAWGERQQVQNILRVQGRPFSHRMSFRDKLQGRGLDTSVGYNAHRSRDPIEPEPVADYLLDPELAEIAQAARDLRERIKRIAEDREQQYPAQHKRILAKVDDYRQQVAAS